MNRRARVCFLKKGYTNKHPDSITLLNTSGYLQSPQYSPQHTLKNKEDLSTGTVPAEAGSEIEPLQIAVH